MINPEEFWSEKLNLKYKKDIYKGQLIGVLFEDNVYYKTSEMKELMGHSKEVIAEIHKVKSIFDSMVEALEQVL